MVCWEHRLIYLTNIFFPIHFFLIDIVDNKEGVMKKLNLIQNLPHSRAKRLMNQWSHPVSVMLRAREHTAEILSGMSIRTSNQRRNVKYRSNAGQYCNNTLINAVFTGRIFIVINSL